MKGTVVLLLAGVTMLCGCASRDGDAISASPILTSHHDCIRDGYTWNAKLGVCEARRPR
jgi:hypothetical protein